MQIVRQRRASPSKVAPAMIGSLGQKIPKHLINAIGANWYHYTLDERKSNNVPLYRNVALAQSTPPPPRSFNRGLSGLGQLI